MPVGTLSRRVASGRVGTVKARMRPVSSLEILLLIRDQRSLPAIRELLPFARGRLLSERIVARPARFVEPRFKSTRITASWWASRNIATGILREGNFAKGRIRLILEGWGRCKVEPRSLSSDARPRSSGAF